MMGKNRVKPLKSNTQAVNLLIKQEIKPHLVNQHSRSPSFRNRNRNRSKSKSQSQSQSQSDANNLAQVSPASKSINQRPPRESFLIANNNKWHLGYSKTSHKLTNSVIKPRSSRPFSDNKTAPSKKRRFCSP